MSKLFIIVFAVILLLELSLKALKVYGHNAYYGCDKCVTKGEYRNRKVVFPQLNADLRNNDDFLNGVYSEYHKQISPLIEIKMDLIEGFPIDYMHSVCLGVD